MDSVNLISYNMHGFKNGFNTVRDLLDHNVIIALQEHWLRNDNLCQLGTFHDAVSYTHLTLPTKRIV